MDQSLALEVLLSGKSALLTGPAGSGKTHVLNEFIYHAKRDGKKVAVTATTGLAATHLSGTTIHSWSGIGILDSLPPKFHENLNKSRKELIKKADILVIDEISMLHDYRLDMVSDVTRAIREIDKPFGGLQVVLCGDFFQLPPVSRGDQPASSFVVQANVWHELDPVVCYLSEQHRQDDDLFLEILNALRANDLRKRHAEALLARQQTNQHQDDVTELHTTNVDVDSINTKKLDALKGKKHEYHMSQSGKENYVQNLKKSCLASETLTLKKGALVMCIKNNQEKRYANGSTGTVVGFEKETNYPKVELKNGRVIIVTPETWELKDGDKRRAALTQIPLRLAWAITVHKSQGMTLDSARIDLRKAFVEGMGYVALSRVRSLDTLSLAGINRMALKVSQQALQIDVSLREKAAADSKKFKHLKAAEKRTQTKTSKKSGAVTWSEKLAAMRKTYPNAYRPWKKTDDEKLLEQYKKGIAIDTLTSLLGRHPGSIEKRIEKLTEK
jgi:ATP-dependent DNA helicase PIF1